MNVVVRDHGRSLTNRQSMGIRLVYLEARSANPQTRAFYRKLGYKEIQLVRGYYQGVEDSVRIGKDLWAGV